MGRLSGRTVVIARAAEQAGRLRPLLEAEGAAVVEVPTIAIEPPADGDGVLREALRDLWDWVVVTSPNGAERAVAAAGGRAAALALRWAVVGPGDRGRASPRSASTPPSCPTASWRRGWSRPSPTLRPTAVGCCWRRRRRPDPCWPTGCGPGAGTCRPSWPTGRCR